jgi:hypothetical protein
MRTITLEEHFVSRRFSGLGPYWWRHRRRGRRLRRPIRATRVRGSEDRDYRGRTKRGLVRDRPPHSRFIRSSGLVVQLRVGRRAGRQRRTITLRALGRRSGALPQNDHKAVRLG